MWNNSQHVTAICKNVQAYQKHVFQKNSLVQVGVTLRVLHFCAIQLLVGKLICPVSQEWRESP